ncbi:MAG: 3-oxoacyl-ACP synthase III [Elusimicrobia bacterium]|nr:3-oxoacyl-ACP synthase III [Elusimicrobiota bacterium]
MNYSKVYLDAIGYELAPNVVASRDLEARVLPVYEKLRLPPGQLEALTGIRERRWWDAGYKLSKGATHAGKKALEAAGVSPKDIGALIYAGVCRESSEPATACAVAHALGIGADAAIFDVSNACLGVLNGILDVANRVELGQIKAGLVVSCESAREINESMIESMLKNPTMDHFRLSMATLTGGSGAVAVLITDGSFNKGGHRLLGGAYKAESRHHELCRWERDFMSTDAAAVLKHGTQLGRQTWDVMLQSLRWSLRDVDKVVCHQVGGAHKSSILSTLGIDESKDFSTYEYLGNIGTVSVPITAALADEREFIVKGDKVAFLGIGSGLNCLMLGWEW